MNPRLEAVQYGWSSLLNRYSWQWFCTFTFRDASIHPEKADKLFRVWTSKLNRYLFGPRWHRRPELACYWVRASELQKRGTIHYHVLIASFSKNLEDVAIRKFWADLWQELAGFARIEAIRSQEQVNDYVTKYTAKGGDLEFSNNLPATGRNGTLSLAQSDGPQ